MPLSKKTVSIMKSDTRKTYKPPNSNVHWAIKKKQQGRGRGVVAPEVQGVVTPEVAKSPETGRTSEATMLRSNKAEPGMKVDAPRDTNKPIKTVHWAIRKRQLARGAGRVSSMPLKPAESRDPSEIRPSLTDFERQDSSFASLDETLTDVDDSTRDSTVHRNFRGRMRMIQRNRKPIYNLGETFSDDYTPDDAYNRDSRFQRSPQSRKPLYNIRRQPSFATTRSARAHMAMYDMVEHIPVTVASVTNTIKDLGRLASESCAMNKEKLEDLLPILPVEDCKGLESSKVCDETTGEETLEALRSLGPGNYNCEADLHERSITYTDETFTDDSKEENSSSTTTPPVLPFGCLAPGLLCSANSLDWGTGYDDSTLDEGERGWLTGLWTKSEVEEKTVENRVEESNEKYVKIVANESKLDDFEVLDHSPGIEITETEDERLKILGVVKQSTVSDVLSRTPVEEFLVLKGEDTVSVNSVEDLLAEGSCYHCNCTS